MRTGPGCELGVSPAERREPRCDHPQQVLPRNDIEYHTETNRKPWRQAKRAKLRSTARPRKDSNKAYECTSLAVLVVIEAKRPN